MWHAPCSNQLLLRSMHLQNKCLNHIADETKQTQTFSKGMHILMFTKLIIVQSCFFFQTQSKCRWAAYDISGLKAMYTDITSRLQDLLFLSNTSLLVVCARSKCVNMIQLYKTLTVCVQIITGVHAGVNYSNTGKVKTQHHIIQQ